MLPQALRVIQHVLRAHAAAYRILHAARRTGEPRPWVGIAHHVPAFWPCRRWWPPDRVITSLTDRIFNVAVLEALTEGRWSVPGVGTWRLPDVQGTLDYFGMNYYGRQFIRWTPSEPVWPGTSCDLGHHPREVSERTSLGWDVHPESFELSFRRWGRLGLPILVTENGAWMDDDARRWRHLLRNLQALARAIQAGVPVVGYCYWSLLDNFEWADGFTPRFGLIEVDYATQRRTIRDSAEKYAEVCRTNRLPNG